jgi:hypothetical protein
MGEHSQKLGRHSYFPRFCWRHFSVLPRTRGKQYQAKTYTASNNSCFLFCRCRTKSCLGSMPVFKCKYAESNVCKRRTKSLPLLSHDAIVSVYYLEDDLERLVGVGKVINVQNDKKVQILITENYDFGEKLNQIMNNSKDELKKLIVKASVPSFILEAISNGR